MMTKEPNFQWDVIVVGAGASGMSAAANLGNNGLRVLALEARSRVGGRIFTQHNSEAGAAVELGAEFVHGRPPEIWDILKHEHFSAQEVQGDMWQSQQGELRKADTFSEVDGILKRMDDKGPDRSFLEFIDQCCPEPSMQEAKKWALSYITGFNAANPAEISVHSLVEERRAEEKIDGDRAFRIEGGYAKLATALERAMQESGVSLRLNAVVQKVEWQRGMASLQLRDGETLRAPKVLITLPLGVLQAKSEEKGYVSFQPALREKQPALGLLAMGKVIRMTFCFRERFWEKLQTGSDRASSNEGHRRENLADMSFLFTEDDLFPTWWTLMPNRAPLITGWAPFKAAEKLASQPNSAIAANALQSLVRILHLPKTTVEDLLIAAYTHNWEADPFARGAYTYVKVGGSNVQKDLAAPMQDTLFFAGEATESEGHHGTVHGAIASGCRAADEILARIRGQQGMPRIA